MSGSASSSAAVKGDYCLKPITELSDEEPSEDEKERSRDVGIPGKKRRRREGPTLKDRLRSRDACRGFVMRRCGGRCKKLCFGKFRTTHRFEELFKFRLQWSELHKLDADRCVSLQHYWMKECL